MTTINEIIAKLRKADAAKEALIYFAEYCDLSKKTHEELSRIADPHIHEVYASATRGADQARSYIHEELKKCLPIAIKSAIHNAVQDSMFGDALMIKYKELIESISNG